MVGVAAVLLNGRGEALILAVALVVLFAALPTSHRRLAAAAVLGLALGYGVATIRATEMVGSAEVVVPETITGTVVSDPRLGARGSSAVVEWRDLAAQRVETLVFYSSSEAVGRSDAVEIDGRPVDEQASILIADELRVIDPAGEFEQRRRAVREATRRRVLSRVPGSNGSLALGLIIGDDSGLTGEERDRLRASGLTHITAVSGSNVALVIVAVAFLLRALNRVGWGWFCVQVVGIIGYVWIVGADPPIVRAAIMGSLILLAHVLGRPSHLFTLLALAGAAMCMHVPETLNSLGFQLSFLSMIGLALAGDLIARTEGVGRKVAVALLSPVGAALLTAPLLAARFGTFSLGTVPANVIVAPLIAPATMGAGIIALVPDGFISGEAVGVLVWGLTGIVLSVSSFVGGSRYAVITFAPLTSAQTVGIYLLLLGAFAPLVPEVRATLRTVRRWTSESPGRAALVAGLVSIVLIASFWLLD